MKKLLLIFIIFITACTGEPAVGDDDPVVPQEESEDVITTIPRATTPPRTTATPRTSTTPAVTTPPEPAPPYISVAEAEQAARNALDPNGEFDYKFSFSNSWVKEVDGVQYYDGSWKTSDGDHLHWLYVDKLTSEVFLSVKGKLMTLPVDEITEALLFVERFNSMNLFDAMPAFDHINEIPLSHILKMYEKSFGSSYYWIIDEIIPPLADFQYTEEEVEKFENHIPIAYGIYPGSVEKFIREKYNPDFRIGHYDFSVIKDLCLSYNYKAVWDAEKDAVAFVYVGSAGGGFGSFSTVLKIEQEGDTFYTVTAEDNSCHCCSTEIYGYSLQTVQKNETGGFIMLSKQAINITEVSFTEEELNDIKALPWIGDIIIEQGGYILP